MEARDLSRQLKKLEDAHRKRVRELLPKVKALVAARPPWKSTRETYKRMLVLLEPWQAEAIGLLSDILGGTVQERLRAWITAAILAESARLR